MGHEDTGSLSVGKRLERLEENDRAIAEDCEQNNRKLWEQIDAMKNVINDMKVEAARSQVKLAAIIGFVTFGGGIVAQLIIAAVKKSAQP